MLSALLVGLLFAWAMVRSAEPGLRCVELYRKPGHY